LLIRTCTTGVPQLMRLRNRIEVEVLGRVVALIRRVGNAG
jgi:hypothetical protein